MENLVPEHKLRQRLQIIFGRMNALREVIDKAIECDDELWRKKCMRYLKPPKRFPAPEEMDNEETAASNIDCSSLVITLKCGRTFRVVTSIETISFMCTK